MTQKRNDFRIEYADGDGPTLIVSAGIYQVIELSASGVRIKFQGDAEAFKDSPEDLKLVLKFPDKEKDNRIQTHGRYYRHGEDYLVFRFSQQIPAKKLNEEQFRLKKKRISSQG